MSDPELTISNFEDFQKHIGWQLLLQAIHDRITKLHADAPPTHGRTIEEIALDTVRLETELRVLNSIGNYPANQIREAREELEQKWS